MPDSNLPATASAPLEPSVVLAAVDTGPVGAQRIEFDISFTAIFRVVGTMAVLWLIAATWQVIIWMLISLMLVATFDPLVRRLQSRVSRPWAIAAVVALSVGLVALVLAMVAPMLLRQGYSLAVNLPVYVARAEEIARGAGVRVNLQAPLQQWVPRFGMHALDLSAVVVNSLAGVATVFVLAIYLLMAGPRAATSVLALLPRKERLPVRRMVGEIGVQVGAYMRGQLVTSLLAGAFTFFVLTVLQVPEPLALAALMMVADVIPAVGPFIGTVPAVLMALGVGVPTALIVLVAYLAYLQLEGTVIVPRVYGNALKLSPLVVVVAFLVGGKLMGITGLLIALPTAAAIPIIARYVAQWRDRVDAASPVLPTDRPAG